MNAKESDRPAATPPGTNRNTPRLRSRTARTPHHPEPDRIAPAQQVGPTRPPEGYAEDTPGSPASEPPKQSGAK